MPKNIKVIKATLTMAQSLTFPSDAVDIIGRFVPIFDGTAWSHTEELYLNMGKKEYPAEQFDRAEYVGSVDKAIFLAMDGNRCIGFVRLARWWNDTARIEDISVASDYRGRGVGTLLLDSATGWAMEQNVYGISLETQTWNLSACRFYLKSGFTLSGIDTHLYTGDHEGETAVFFFKPL